MERQVDDRRGVRFAVHRHRDAQGETPKRDRCRDPLVNDDINVLNTEPVDFPIGNWKDRFHKRIAHVTKRSFLGLKRSRAALLRRITSAETFYCVRYSRALECIAMLASWGHRWREHSRVRASLPGAKVNARSLIV